MQSAIRLGCALLLATFLPACPPPAPVPPATVFPRFTVPARGLPAPLEVPFPSDLYRTGAGGTVTDKLGNWSNLGVTQQMNTLQYAYAGLDGFGHTSGALFLIEGEGTLDPASLPRTGAACLLPDSAVAIVDVDERTGADPVRLPCVAHYVEELKILVVQPEGTPLRGGRRYAVVLSDRVTTMDRQVFGAGPEFAALRDAVGDARTTAAGALYGAAVDRVGAVLGKPFAGRHLAGMAVYSASTEHKRLRLLRDALVAGDYGPAPQLLMDEPSTSPFKPYRFGATAKPGDTATLDEWLGTPRREANGQDSPGAPGGEGSPEPASTGWPHDSIAVVLQGAFTSPEFRRSWAGTPAPQDGTLEIDATGKVLAQPGLVKIPVTIVLPKSLPPPTGYPVVIAAHGTPTHRQFVMNFANELARAGIAVVAMDGQYHGVRGRDGADLHSNYPGTYLGADGFTDLNDTLSSTLDLSASFKSAPRYRANMWQFEIEWCQLRRLLAAPDLDLSAAAGQFPPGTGLRFDPTRIGWVGSSFGAVTGAMLLSAEPGISSFFLNVGNGDQLQWQGQSPSNRPTLGFAALLFGFPDSVALTRFNPLITVAFGAIEPVFAAASAEEVGRGADAPGPNVLMTEVEFDEYISNRGTELLAASLQIPQVSPNARQVELLAQVPSPVQGNANGRTRALVHMGSASHGGNLSRRWATREYLFPEQMEDDVPAPFTPISPPLWVRQPVAATQAMLVKFFQTGFEGPAVIDASQLPLRIDFDDDGFCDATERAAGKSWTDPASHPTGPQDCAWDPGY